MERGSEKKPRVENAGFDGIVSLLSAIVDSSHDAIVSKTLDGIIISWNPAAENMFGYTAAEATGQSIRLIIPAELQAEEDYVLSQLRRGEKVDNFETVRQTKDGRRLDISLTVSPIGTPWAMSSAPPRSPVTSLIVSVRKPCYLRSSNPRMMP